MRNFIFSLLLIIFPALVFAQRKDVGLGGVATSLMSPVSLATDFLHTGCFIIGIAFIFASFVKYMDHRRSPTMVPFSTVVFLIIGGLTLIAIPLFT